MSWCPKCKNEYREGILVCADCGCQLVEELPVGKETEAFAQEEPSSVSAFDAQAAASEVLASQGELQEAPPKEAPKQYVPYKRNADKAEDNRSSAWTLLLVGSVGLIAVILCISGVFTLRIGNPYMFYGVMSAVFLLFIVMGVISMKNARIFQKKAESENSLRETLEKWCKEKLRAEEIDAELADGEDITLLPEEVLYFRRYEKLKEKVNYQFMNLDQALVENLLDETVYDMVFEK